MKKLFLLLSLCCISFVAWADEYTDENGVTWEYNLNGYWDEANQTQINGAVITKCSNYGTEIVVPEAIQVDEESYNVLRLEGDIFNDGSESKYSITSVTLPSSLTSIGWNVFNGLNLLKTLNVPEGLTSIESGAFSGCQSLVLTLPASLKTVGYGAFRSCKMVSLPFTDPTSLGNNISISYVFNEVSRIAVPDDAIEAYKNSQVWVRYVEKIYGHSEVVEYTHTDENNVTWTYCYVLSSSSVRIVEAEGYSADIVVPATLTCGGKEYPVTVISDSLANDENIVSVDLSKTSITATPSFRGCPSLTSVSLPATLKEISAHSFYGCDNLQTINFSDATALEKIGSYAFYNCDMLQSADLSATKVKTIEYDAFSSCDKLGTVFFPSTLTSIGSSAFSSCISLNSIDLSATILTELGNSAFNSCALKSVVLPATLKKIGNNAFVHNSSLTINLSEVEEIGEGAFRYTYLSTADLSSAKVIGANAFAGSNATFTINSSTPATIKANSFTENSKFIVSPDAYDTFCSAAIWSNWKDNISMYTIDSNNIKWIYRYLADSNSMCITGASDYGTEVTVPGALPYNGTDYPVTHLENTFSSANITSIILPSTLTHIGDYAFAYSKLSSINIPASVTTIGSHAFYYNYNLTSVTFDPNSVLESIGDYAFAGNEWYYEECNKLASIEIPATVKNIGEGAFRYCRYLKSIDLSNVETIGDYAFQECYNLNSIDLSKVETIGDYAFSSTNLNSVDLSSAKTIGNNAFTGETFFSIDNTVPATIESEAFSTSATFLVPGSAITDYKTANVWSDYASRIFASNIAKQTINVTAESNTSAVLTAIGGSANQTSVIDLKVIGTINSYDIVVLHDKMIELRYLDLSEARIVANPYCYYENYCTEDDVLGPNSFRSKSRLISIKLPAEIKSIGSAAFNQCSKLSEVVIPNSVTRIEDDAFSSCHNLQFITLPNKLEYIGVYAFAWGGLKEIAFPTTLTHIDWGAFENSQLETVRIPSSLQYVGGGAFRGCSNLKKVYTYTIEPTDINEETFSNFETAMLYVPVASGQNYYWDEGWKRFLNIWEFDAEAQTTLKGSQEQQATGARSITRAINPDRKLVNIVLSNGEKSDRTRIVFNNKVSMEYEMECDAAKFDAAGVPQLYTLDSRAVKYAINERPVAEGVVTLGYSAPAEGTYTLEAPRMDTPVFVKDNVTRIVHNFSEGSYEFYSEAGTFEGRFTILTKSGATGIDGVVLDEQQDERIYNLNGQRVNKATGKGIYIKNNRKEVNM